MEVQKINLMIDVTHATLCRAWAQYKSTSDEPNAAIFYARAQGCEMAAEAAGLTLDRLPIFEQAQARKVMN